MKLPTFCRFTTPAAACALMLAGCSSTNTYQVKVDAITKQPAAAPAGTATASSDLQSYKLKNKNPANDESNLRYKEAAEYVKTALSAKGLYEAPTQEGADMIVEVDYGMDAPRTKIETVSVPVYAQTGGGVRYEQVPITDSRGNQSVRTVAVYQPPRTELVGFDDVPRMVTIYEKYLRVTAMENKPGEEGRPPAQVWSVSASAEDESKDLRKFLPVLASATADYIGKDSDKEKVVKIRDPSQITDFIRKGMSDNSTNQTAPLPPTPVGAWPKG
jgi:hypothetical protein